MTEEIQTKVVIEILGKPKEHVDTTIKKYVDKILENFKVTNHVLYEAEELKDEKFKGMFSSFVDFDMNFKDFNSLVIFCFDFMPSSVEIVNPKRFDLDSEEVMSFLNDLMTKLHDLDMMVKNLSAENVLLKRELDKKEK
tara:strand:- start:454 stop:870 length:417 start_codon:yes stop_codon:yes gene_type:complete